MGPAAAKPGKERAGLGVVRRGTTQDGRNVLAQRAVALKLGLGEELVGRRLVGECLVVDAVVAHI